MYSPRSFYIYEELDICKIQIVSCWEVTCGIDYSYTKTRQDIDNYPRDLLCAIRVTSGLGRIITNNNIFELASNSLLILKSSEIIKYFSTSELWKYSWCNFIPRGNLPPLLCDTVYELPIDENEVSCFGEMFELLKNYNDISNTIATLLFTTQFYRWAQYVKNFKTASMPYYKEINECITYINQNFNQKINVNELANKYNFSERHFRNLFITFTGKSPKAYHRFLRLKNACSQLKNTDITICALSDSLGYCSQFQFCRDFKNEFGIPPSEYKQSD